MAHRLYSTESMSGQSVSPRNGARPSNHVNPRGLFVMTQHYIGDLVYGANDSILTSFAVVAGVTGGALSARTVLIVGMANLFTDGLSIGVGNYLSIRARESALEQQQRPEEEAHPTRHGSPLFWPSPWRGWCPCCRICCPALSSASSWRPHVRSGPSSRSVRDGLLLPRADGG